MLTMRDADLRELIVMTNSVLGISILTMPFCFQQCGLLLGTLSLVVSASMTSYSCKLLVQLISIKKTKTFEFLALRILGHKAKLLLEISIILLLFGSLVTYHQTVSDSGPNFLIKLFNLKAGAISRTWFMVIFTVAIILPLSLLKKLDNINKLSVLAIFFYFTLGFYLFWEALNKISSGGSERLNSIVIWNFDGLVKCFPIFSISFSCQTVLFVVYDELPDHSKNQMSRLSDRAILVSFSAYFLSGFFGYLAFGDLEIPGNVITIIPESFMSQTIIFGFIVCVVAGFPFMVFPCRTSLNTLFFATDADEIIETDLFIPENRFNYLTYALVFSTAWVAVAIPNMEFVLSFTGATAGSLICYVWPSILYIYAVNMSKESKDLVTRSFLIMGIVIFCICTTATLIEYQPTKPEVPLVAEEPLPLDKFEKADYDPKVVLPAAANEENPFLPRENGAARSLMSYTIDSFIGPKIEKLLNNLS